MVAMFYSGMDLTQLPDCERLLENGKCGKLSISRCMGEACSFYQKKSSLFKAQSRLRSLDEDVQERISNKYYGGFRPWVDTALTSGRH